jgi:hypothetical protein
MSKIEVDAIEPQSGTTLTIGASGDTITIPSGATLSSTDPLVFPAGTASLPAITTTGDINTGIFFPAADTIAFSEGGTEAMRIDSSGRLGIGTTTPSAELHISKSADGSLTELILENTFTDTGSTDEIVRIQGRFGGFDASYITTGKEADFTTSGNRSSFMSFWTRGAGTLAERMRINGNGNIQIGTTTESARLHIASSTTAGTDPLVVFSDASGTDCGSIDLNATANTVAYTTSSDYRLKENVSYDFDATTRLKQLRPARFNFKTDADTTVDGFIAHEVQSVVPEAITGTHNEVKVWKEGEELPEGVSVGDNKLDENGNTIPVYQGIDQSKLVPLLVKTIQELEARITQLENA